VRRKTELVIALIAAGRRLDAATDPAEMKAAISDRKRITAALEAAAPPPLRIYRP